MKYDTLTETFFVTARTTLVPSTSSYLASVLKVNRYAVICFSYIGLGFHCKVKVDHPFKSQQKPCIKVL